MGQRSQIYVRFENEQGKKVLIARYYGWNYGERMISRARHSIEWINDEPNRKYHMNDKLYRILDTNFDMKDVVISSDIIKEYIEDEWNCTLNEFFIEQDNNNGVLLIDVLSDCIKYAFLNWEYKYLGDGIAYMNNDQGDYLKETDKYHNQEDIDNCLSNIQWIKDNAVLMSEEESDEFLQHDYNWQLETYRSSTPQYAVIVYYSFVPESVVYLFDDYNKACEYMKNMWQYCYDSELIENEESVDQNGSYCNENYAEIKWGDEDNRTRIWQVVGTSEPMKTN